MCDDSLFTSFKLRNTMIVYTGTTIPDKGPRACSRAGNTMITEFAGNIVRNNDHRSDPQGIAERTVQRKWEKARISLHRSLRTDVSL
jgi:hypothetical protein